MTPMQPQAKERSLALLLVALVLTASPLRTIWTHPVFGWWGPFVMWLGLICGGLWIALGRGDLSD